MEFVGWWRENDKRHASKHIEQGPVRASGDGVGGRGNVLQASQAGAHLSFRRGIKDLHTAGERAEAGRRCIKARGTLVPEMESGSSKVKPDP